jgi:hypothetical protein
MSKEKKDYRQARIDEAADNAYVIMQRMCKRDMEAIELKNELGRIKAINTVVKTEVVSGCLDGVFNNGMLARTDNLIENK